MEVAAKMRTLGQPVSPKDLILVASPSTPSMLLVLSAPTSDEDPEVSTITVRRISWRIPGEAGCWEPCGPGIIYHEEFEDTEEIVFDQDDEYSAYIDSTTLSNFLASLPDSEDEIALIVNPHGR